MQQHHQKLVTFILFLAIISVVIYAVLKSKKDKSTNSTNLNFNADTGGSQTSTGNTTGNGTNTGGSSNLPDSTFPLKKGSTGKYVKALQKGLNQKFFSKLSEDGKFGSKTQAAVERYLDPITIKQGAAKPSKTGVWWSLFKALGFEKYI